MGRRGPKKSDDKVRQFTCKRGGAGASGDATAGADGGVAALDVAPDPPDWLIDGAQDEWGRLAPLLVEMGVLFEVDLEALARLCDLRERYRGISHSVRRSKSLTYKARSKDGKQLQVVARPELGMMTQISREIRQLENHFGLSPAARQNVKIKPKKMTDELDAWKSRNA